jgi:GAF domain/Pyridoxamine 5'-phosphate oxidase
MNLALETMAPCFQGLFPATLYTCSADGIPNVAYLSHVDYVDPSHVALSFQFFNKSRRNIAENPRALVCLMDPDTGQGWRLELRFVRSETTGPVFERMALRIEAIASYSGLKGIFKLLAADIYEVLSIRKAPEESAMRHATPVRHAPPDAVFTTRALQDFASRIQAADSLEQLLDSILAGIEEIFGFSNSMILLPGEHDGVLVAIASRGYAETGVGAEVRFGEGIAGMVGEARKPIRISGLMRGMLYALAVRKRAEEAGLCPENRRITMPGLAHPESQLGVPLLVRGELVGVLCIESEIRYRFHEEDKTTLELLGSYLAIAIQNMLFRERSEATELEPAAASTHEAAPTGQRLPCHNILFYGQEEVIMVDGDYLIRGLPARIFWKLLRLRDEQGRTEFTNRELRLDKTLNLAEWRDNLETRLLLLRRRLDQKCRDIRIVPRARGRFALELVCQVTLADRP